MSVSMAFSAVVGGEVLDSHLMMYVNCMCVCMCVCVCVCVCVSCSQLPDLLCTNAQIFHTARRKESMQLCDFFSAKPAFFAVLFMPA